MISRYYLDVVECDTIFQLRHHGLYCQVPLNVVNEAPSASAEFAFVLQKPFTISQGLPEIPADFRKSLQIPFVILCRE